MAEHVRVPAFILLVMLVLACTGSSLAAQPTSGTVMRVGSSYIIPAGANHNGGVVVFGGNISVLGNLNGRAIAIGGAVEVNGTVTGDIIALGGRVILREGAQVSGSVTAVGGGVERADHVQLRGEVNSISLSQGLRVPQFHLFPFNLRSFPIYSLYLIGLYLSALIIAYLFADQAVAVEHTLLAFPGKSALVGILTLILIVPLTIVMAFTVVGLPLVLLTWLTFFVAKLLGYMAVAAATGRLSLGKLGQRLPLPVNLAIGVVLLGFLRAVPYAGFLFGILVLAMGLGAALISHFGVRGVWWPFVGRKKPNPPEPQP